MPSPLTTAFAAWTGAACPRCGLPALLHGERCDEGDDGLPADALERESPANKEKC